MGECLTSCKGAMGETSKNVGRFPDDPRKRPKALRVVRVG